MTDLSRRLFLGGALATAVAAPFAASTAFGRLPAAHATGGVPLTFSNNTGSWDAANIWITIVGTSPGQGDGHVDQSGAFHPMSLSDNANPDGTASWGFRLSDAGSVPLPDFSGRICVSLGSQLPFKVVETPTGIGRQDPTGWIPDQPGWDIIWDFIEFTNDGAGLHINATQVDMFSVPMTVTLDGAQHQVAGKLNGGGRAAIFDQVRNTDGYGSLVVDDRRVIAPSHGIDSGFFDGSYLDGYVNDVWSKYAGTDLNVATGSASYRLRVEGDQFNAYNGSSLVTSFARPSTRDVLYCDGNLSAPNDGVRGPIAAILGAGLNRTTLLDHADQPVGDPGQFYQGARTNAYAKALHANMADGRAYGFAFDDVGGFASYIEDGAPSGVNISIDAF
jgi:hypothetical protein